MKLSMSVIGFFHTLACILALSAGAWLMVARKGTPRHRRWGDVYTAAILFASVSSLRSIHATISPWPTGSG